MAEKRSGASPLRAAGAAGLPQWVGGGGPGPPRRPPDDLIPITVEGYGCPGKSTLLDGFIAMELARVDPSIATFYGVYSGLAMGSIYLCGSEEQKQRWLPAMARLEQIGAFGLTEPEVGSSAAGGLTTTARRAGDIWVLNGEKKQCDHSGRQSLQRGAATQCGSNHPGPQPSYRQS